MLEIVPINRSTDFLQHRVRTGPWPSRPIPPPPRLGFNLHPAACFRSPRVRLADVTASASPDVPGGWRPLRCLSLTALLSRRRRCRGAVLAGSMFTNREKASNIFGIDMFVALSPRFCCIASSYASPYSMRSSTWLMPTFHSVCQCETSVDSVIGIEDPIRNWTCASDAPTRSLMDRPSSVSLIPSSSFSYLFRLPSCARMGDTASTRNGRSNRYATTSSPARKPSAMDRVSSAKVRRDCRSFHRLYSNISIDRIHQEPCSLPTHVSPTALTASSYLYVLVMSRNRCRTLGCWHVQQVLVILDQHFLKCVQRPWTARDLISRPQGLQFLPDMVTLRHVQAHVNPVGVFCLLGHVRLVGFLPALDQIGGGRFSVSVCGHVGVDEFVEEGHVHRGHSVARTQAMSRVDQGIVFGLARGDVDHHSGGVLCRG